MKPKFEIPLSYNPIPEQALSRKLRVYSNRHHDDLIFDFEKSICAMTGAKFAVALNSGTAAIHLGLKALCVQTGDVVMASTFTYVASINPIIYLGAIPFFIDSSMADWNMDPNLLEEGIKRCISTNKKPKAILIVHTYGVPAEMNAIMEISNRYQIPVLEDAAEAIGSTYGGRFVGTLGEIGIFSFNNNKLITAYGGGILLTNNESTAVQVNSWASQSRDNLPFYEHREIGFNYKMGPLNAAMALSQIELLPEKIAGRRKVNEAYQNRLLGKVEFQKEGKEIFSNRWITAVKLSATMPAEELQNQLAQQKIETRPLWKPMHLQPVFKEFDSCVNGCSEELFDGGICLPSGENLRSSEINAIAEFLIS